jgi:hypothetical protein
MASTRRINNPADYELEQSLNTHKMEYITTKEYGVAHGTYLPGNGLLQGKLGMESIASNQIDIESSLYGIGASNLVEKKTPVVPNIYPLNSLNISDKKNTILPKPLVIDSNQRPNEL